MLTLEEREILARLIDFGEENWSALSQRYEDATGEELTDEAFESMKGKLLEF